MTTPSYTDWFVGMKVVCTSTWREDPGLGYGDEIGPVKGQVYTIREIGYLFDEDDTGICLRLAEIVNPTRPYEGCDAWEQCFGAYRFRPLVTRKTDISIFTAMLNPANSKVEA